MGLVELQERIDRRLRSGGTLAERRGGDHRSFGLLRGAESGALVLRLSDGAQGPAAAPARSLEPRAARREVGPWRPRLPDPIAAAEAAEELRRVTARRDFLEREVLTDPLTSLLTRSAFSAQLATELARARRGKPRGGRSRPRSRLLQAGQRPLRPSGGGRGSPGVADRVSARVSGRAISPVEWEATSSYSHSSTLTLNSPTESLPAIGRSVEALEFGPATAPELQRGHRPTPLAHSVDLDELVEHADHALYGGEGGGTQSDPRLLGPARASSLCLSRRPPSDTVTTSEQP